MTADPALSRTSGVPEVGQRLRAARARAGMTRKQLALLSGTSERYLALLEGGGGNPSLEVLTGLAGAIDIALADLLPLGGELSEAHARAVEAVRRLQPEQLPELAGWLGRPGARGDKAGRILLLGLRGAGKTSLGKELAAKRNVPFVEMSKEVERAYGGEIGLLIELGGQPALRRYERDAWETICASHDEAVIAAPGGVVADASLYDRVLATAHCVWLKADPEDHMERVMAQGDFRPMRANRGAMADLKAILEARSAEYSRADADLDTSAQDFGATVELLHRLCERLPVHM